MAKSPHPYIKRLFDKLKYSCYTRYMVRIASLFFVLLLLIPLETSILANISARQVSNKDFQCLARTIYFEAGGESHAGMVAVGLVILNRTTNGKFPPYICGVTTQGKYTGSAEAKAALLNSRYCQFSWYCSGNRHYHPSHPDAWLHAQEVATLLLTSEVYDFTRGATYYHAKYVRPSWAKTMNRTATIDNHIFYRDPN